MSEATAQIRYFAAKPLPVERDGERLVLQAGDEILDPEAWGRSLQPNIELGRIVVLPVPDDLLALASDDDLLAEVRRRGLTLPRAAAGSKRKA